jgi:hypothetical protein
MNIFLASTGVPGFCGNLVSIQSWLASLWVLFYGK